MLRFAFAVRFVTTPCLCVALLCRAQLCLAFATLCGAVLCLCFALPCATSLCFAFALPFISRLCHCLTSPVHALPLLCLSLLCSACRYSALPLRYYAIHCYAFAFHRSSELSFAFPLLTSAPLCRRTQSVNLYVNLPLPLLRHCPRPLYLP